ncbi:alpha/beta fold hydrolase [Xanthomonas prunicola]|uniref:alpha/beta hydrolase n=1 Tax=Xanthomonas prunicola TaxID=2053930 RepID=UPI0021B328EB|nr:alpha/beta fold hydrolase [Xanthomonas prunicola]UXA47178.1 alpha/beta fold hydrolase [Xanthomonas prunicola]UXA55650.1 alpha/beta fold hydrolase [Xanthomonas prunicola]
MIHPNNEFFLSGGRSGVLLVHGLTGTPAEMRRLGIGLHRTGFTVHGVQLAGHCGDMDDLLATGWRDWYGSVERAAEALATQVDQVFVAGLSMGALLALELAIERPELVAGVGVYGVTFRYDGWNIPWTRHLSFLLPAFKLFGIGRRRMFLEESPYGLRDERLRARIAAAMQGGDSSVAGLPGNPWHSLAELRALSARVRRRLPKVIAPCLVAHAAEDDVASLRNARMVLDGVSGATEFLLMEDSYHMLTLDRQRGLLTTASASFFERVVGSELQPQPATAWRQPALEAS